MCVCTYSYIRKYTYKYIYNFELKEIAVQSVDVKGMGHDVFSSAPRHPPDPAATAA